MRKPLEIGTLEMIRFVQQSETGREDYTKEKDQWLGNPDLDKLSIEKKWDSSFAESKDLLEELASVL